MYKWAYNCVFYCAILLILPQLIFANDNIIVVKNIDISGYEKTKLVVIKYEIDISVGDTILTNNWNNKLTQIKNNLINTGLFSRVDITTKKVDSILINIIIDLQEIWYLYPSLIFELSDRSFNSWWYNHNHSLKRVNYGVRLSNRNSSGHKDPLVFVAHTGYTQKIELDYFYPYFTKNKNIGFGFNIFFRGNKEVGYKSENNKPLFFRSDRNIYNRFRSAIRMNYRVSILRDLAISFEYDQNSVTEEVAMNLNPRFFLKNKQSQKSFVINFFGQHTNLDRKVYPIEGIHLEVTSRKEGLGIYNDVNLWSIHTKFKHYIPITKKLSTGYVIKAKVDLIRTKRGYYNNIAVGYGENQIRGYDLYVIDGMDYGFIKTHIKYKMLDYNVNVLKRLNIIPTLQFIPVEIFTVVNIDMGFVNDPFKNDVSNTLVNTKLYGGGLGFHIVLYNNFTLKAEYNFNHLGEGGMFWYFNTGL